MGIDESLFNFFFKKIKNKFAVIDERESLGVYSHKLEIIASAIAGRKIEIVGHPGAAFLSDNIIFLPSTLGKVGTPFRHYLWLVISSLEWRHLLSRERGAPFTSDLVASLLSNYPEHSEEINQYAHDLALPPRLMSRPSSGSAEAASPAVSKKKDISVKTQNQPRSTELREEQENPLVHSFEKIHSVDDYVGGQKSADGEDELSEHGDALKEVTLSTVTRSAEPAHSVIDTDAWTEASVPEGRSDIAIGKKIYFYPEWSYQKRKYLKDWCRLLVQPIEETAEALAVIQAEDKKGNVNELKKFIENFKNRMRWERRLRDGTEIDLEAFIDVKADLVSGKTPSDQFYMRQRKTDRDVAISLLMDRSLSTDTYVQGVRVMDLLQESVGLFASALNESDSIFSIAAYRSESRQRCYYDVVKDFSEGGARVPARLKSLLPSGYTRIGPALRHASFELSKQTARKKIIVVFTDLKPTDYDFYEGPYGLMDVRKAIQECQGQGVFVFGLIVNQKRMIGGRHGIFSPGSFSYVRSSNEIVTALEKILMRAWA